MNLLSHLSRFGHDLSSNVMCVIFPGTPVHGNTVSQRPFRFLWCKFSCDVVIVVTCQLSVVDAGEAPCFFLKKCKFQSIALYSSVCVTLNIIFAQTCLGNFW